MPIESASRTDSNDFIHNSFQHNISQVLFTSNKWISIIEKIFKKLITVVLKRFLKVLMELTTIIFVYVR